jgi:arylsulfatase A
VQHIPTLLTALLLAPLAALQAGDLSRQTEPNILYILADDLGYGDLSCYPNHAGASTPNIDRLDAENTSVKRQPGRATNYQ